MEGVIIMPHNVCAIWLIDLNTKMQFWTYARQNALNIQPPIWENQGLYLLKFLFSVFCFLFPKQKDYQRTQIQNTPKNTKAVFTFYVT
jgi:hypothetical protein